jgi:LuxR family maltose regulon positive regulatory protein
VEPGSPGGQLAGEVLAAGAAHPPRPRGSERAAPAATQQGLADPLSERELDILRLLDSDLGGPAIARELSVSVNTVRTHTRHIYAKLGVTSRREAVREAARLGLLRHPSR